MKLRVALGAARPAEESEEGGEQKCDQTWRRSVAEQPQWMPPVIIRCQVCPPGGAATLEELRLQRHLHELLATRPLVVRIGSARDNNHYVESGSECEAADEGVLWSA